MKSLALFGFRFNNSRKSYLTLAFLCVSTSLVSSALQEHVFRTQGFQFQDSVTFLTVLLYFTFGAVEMKITGSRRNASWNKYLILSFFSFCVLALTNQSLRYMDYATRTVFKSGKILPVMGFSGIILGKKHTLTSWLAACLLVVGLILFSLGDSMSLGHFGLTGPLLISCALCAEAFAANFEERYFFKTSEPSATNEVICFSSMFGSLYAFGAVIISQTVSDASVYFVDRLWLVFEVLAFSFLGYISVKLILTLIAFFGATEAELVKYLRRTLTIVNSLVLFQKQFTVWHAIGFTAVLLSYTMTFRANGRICAPSAIWSSAATVLIPSDGEKRDSKATADVLST